MTYYFVGMPECFLERKEGGVWTHLDIHDNYRGFISFRILMLSNMSYPNSIMTGAFSEVLK